MAEHGHEFIIVKRHEEEEHEAHSSAWKVAHADFMTAMMAFFLIMWLINATDDKVRRGISQYFNPIHMSDGQSGMKGLAKPGESVEKENGVKQGGKGNNKKDEFNPLKLSPGAADDKAVEAGSGAGAEGGESAAAGAAPEGANPKGSGSGGGIISAVGHVGAGAAPASEGAGDGAAASSHGEVEGAAATGQTGGGTGTYGGTGVGNLAAFGDAREHAAFQDPYAVLAKLAAQYSTEHPTSSAVIIGDDRKAGLAGGEVDRDPFDPVYWQLAGTPPARTDLPGKPGTAAAVPEGATPDASAMAAHPDEARPAEKGLEEAKEPSPPATPPELSDAKLRPTKLEPLAEAPAAAVEPAAPAKMEAAAPAEPKPAPAEPPAAAAPPGLDAAVVKSAEAVRAAISRSVAPTVAADAGSPAISVVATSEGVAIDLTDAANFTMFDVGSAVPKGKVVVLMAEIAKVLADKPGDIIIRGHTDGRPFHSDQYDNWRLSAARAHMAYYMLTRGGLAESRVMRIEGTADRDLRNKADPLAAENRRIEILLVPSKP